MEGVNLILAEGALGALARKAIDRKTGARGLRSIIEALLLDTMFDLPRLEGVEEVTIYDLQERLLYPLTRHIAGERGIASTCCRPAWPESPGAVAV
jgi:hypothetical protein